MKHSISTHHRTRALSLLCALAIFMSLLPAALAADAAGSTALTNALEDAVVPNTVSPSGIQLNLFDYWVGTRTSTDTDTKYASVKDSGINKDHYLKFNSGGPMSVGANNINQWTGYSGKVFSGIVQDQLSGGYPVLSTGKVYGANNSETVGSQSGWVTSLAYLFDQSQQIDAAAEGGTPTGIVGKKAYWDVDGLLQIDSSGYYYYNANQNNVDVGKYESANYACFNEAANAFTLYNKWGVTSGGGSGISGQFFPFTDPKTVFTLDSDQNLTQASISSGSTAIRHYFGMTMTTRFVQRYDGMTTKGGSEPMTFQFSGDDDVWIFIDGILVADLGGIHNQASTTINFATGEIEIEWIDNRVTKKSTSSLYDKMQQYYPNSGFWREKTLSNDTYHTLKLFYLERGGMDSNLAMKFNLAHVPETDGIKVDQFGNRLNGVEFDLYAAKVNTGNGAHTEPYIVDESKGEHGLLASGMTNAQGRFVLADGNTSAVISLNELNNQGIQYLILRERSDRAGYRPEEDIYLELEAKGTDVLLLNDFDHQWSTGTHAMPKETVYTGPRIQLRDQVGTVTGTADLSSSGTLFAVIMRRLSGMGNDPHNKGDWGVVTGDPINGWQMGGIAVRGDDGMHIGTVLDAVKKVVRRQRENPTANIPDNFFPFKLSSNGSYMAELTNCPGDIRNYYFRLRDHGGNTANTDYAIAYYYTTADDILNATAQNTSWVVSTNFERQFAATLYIPNVKNHLNVQKVDDLGQPVSGAEFALFRKDDLTVSDGAWDYAPGKSEQDAYDTVTTDENGKAVFPSSDTREEGLLATGEYYLVELDAPAGYRLNPTPVHIVADERGVLADAGTADDGVSVSITEGDLVRTMTQFAISPEVDRTLSDVTTTRLTGEYVEGTGVVLRDDTDAAVRSVNLSFDEETFQTSGGKTLRYRPTDLNDTSSSWSTDTGWLWHRVQQNYDVGDTTNKTNLGARDITRLFTGETTVTVTDQRIGSLAVTKNVVVVDDTSSDRPDPDAAYRVTVTLALDGKPINDAVACEDSAHKLQIVRFDNGEAVLSLNAGQTITFPDLPVGTAWTVEETETLSSDLWRTAVTVNGQSSPLTASGTIDRADRDSVVITNRYAHYDEYTAAVTEQFKVTKIYTAGGEYSIYPGRVSFVLKDANGSAIQTISIDGKASAEFDALRFDHTGTYTYTVEEVNGLVDGMHYDPTVYTVDITVTENDAEHRLDAAVTWRDNAYDAEKGLTFTNTYTEPDPEGAVVENALNVRKQYAAGSSDPAHVTTLFQIEAVTENAPMPNETQIHILGAHSASFGSLVFNKAGTYVYHVTEIPAHLLGLQCDPTVYTVTFVVTKTGGKLTAAVSYAIGETEYLYSEAGNVLTFTNAFENKAEELKHASLSLTKEIGEGIDPDTTFDFLIEVNGASSSYDATQNGTASSVTFTDGKATVQLKGGETLVIANLPAGALYTIQETTTGYTVAKTGDTGALSGGQTATAHFTNTKSGSGENPKPNPEPAPEPGDGGNDGGTPALNRRDHYAYIIGYPDGDVHPQGNITRAEVATIFFRLLRDPVRTQYWSQTNGYSDVPGNKWYNNAISTLSNMGIICGYPDGTFRPDAPITRAELTKIAAGFFSDPRVAATYDGRFSDVHGAEWYISYLMTALEEGLIEGYPDGSFRPNRPITRAETCTIVNRTLGRKPEKDHLLPESDMINWPDNINRNIWYYAQMQEATNSHDYRWISIGSEACEQWTAKLAERDWAALERTWSHANSAPGGEVMQ